MAISKQALSSFEKECYTQAKLNIFTQTYSAVIAQIALNSLISAKEQRAIAEKEALKAINVLDDNFIHILRDNEE